MYFIDEANFKPKWNSIDGNVNRESYTSSYDVQNGYPLNPVGRTGMSGRGVLGRWGPNHAADPVVTRWKHNKTDVQIKYLLTLPYHNYIDDNFSNFIVIAKWYFKMKV